MQTLSRLSKEAAPAEFDQEAPNFPINVKFHKEILIFPIEWHRRRPKKYHPPCSTPHSSFFGTLFPGFAAVDSLGFGAALSALLGLGTSGQPTMGATDVPALDGGRFTLESSALAGRLTLFACDPATSR